MNRLEDMLLRNGLICHNSSGERLYLEGSLLQGSLVVRNASGYVTHRVRKASNGVDLVLVNTSTGLVDERIVNGALLGNVA